LEEIFIQKGAQNVDHFTCELLWIGHYSWLISSITFNFQFKFALCFKHMFSKLCSLVCVYVHFRMRGTTKGAFIYIVDLVKMFWQTNNYTFDNMFNLHKMQQHIIEMQMDYQQDILVKVLMRMKVRVIRIWSYIIF